jgi:serine/threonine-protein kinase RsbW
MGSTPQPQAGAGRFEQTWVLYEQRESIERLQSEVSAALHAHAYDDAAAFAIRLALEEALVNGFRHGNKGNPDKRVTVFCVIDGEHVRLEVTDEGEGFEPEEVADPLAPENLLKSSGRGIFLIRSFMDDLTLRRVPEGGMEVRMVKRRPDAPAS